METIHILNSISSNNVRLFRLQRVKASFIIAQPWFYHCPNEQALHRGVRNKQSHLVGPPFPVFKAHFTATAG